MIDGKQQINEMITTVKSRQFHRYINARPDLKNWLDAETSQYKTANCNEQVWIIVNGKPPVCDNGNKHNFNTFDKGYWNYCDDKTCGCKTRGKSEKLKSWHNTLTSEQKSTMIDNSKKTFIEHYGVDNPMKLDSIKDKLKQTNQEKYGVDFALQRDDVREKISKKNITMTKPYVVYYSPSAPIPALLILPTSSILYL